MPAAGPRVRVDAWIWGIRLFKTRTAAAAACRAGHVRVNGDRAKPATLVGIGDQVTVRADRERVVQVRRLLTKRVSAAAAAECYIDHSPPPPPRGQVARREPGAGRPTKRQRREIDRLRGLRPRRGTSSPDR